MDQLVGFLLHPPPSEIAEKLGKMLKYTPHFQGAFGTAEPTPSHEPNNLNLTISLTTVTLTYQQLHSRG